jgi:tetratricopeptide (TPR) repeat protein
MPEGAQVTINGKRVGAAPVLQTYPGGDEFKVRVEMAGYEPAERTVKLLNGYGHQIRVPLMAARSVGAVSPAANMANDMFQKGQDAESRQQWEVAEMAYNTVLGGDAKFAPAYQRLAEMHMQRGNYPKAIETLIKMTNQVPSTHSWSMLSRAYASFAMQAKAEAVTEKKGKKPARVDVRTFRNPRNGDEAAAFAVEAAKRALQMGGSTTEANLSAGFASIAADAGGKNKPEAMNYLSKAVVLDDRDANVHFGQGFAMRYFAPFLAVAAQKAELQRARKSLEKAVDLRPDFYEAHRELGYCAQMLDDNPAALKHYQIASSLRGSTEDGDDVAGVDVAMSTIHKEEAQKTTDPEKKAEHEAASEGYITDAKDNSKTGNLTNVMKRLVFNGMGGSMRDFLSDALPPGVRQAMDIANDPRAALENEKNRQIDKVTDGITGKIGGIFGR